jgi:hypothetical protein
MNLLEKQMTDILKSCGEVHGAVSVKAEFEAEGTRMDELLRLVEIARKANLEITVKIGGCEAIRDLLEAKQIGVQYIVAPMVETSYAASKFSSAKNLVFSEEEAKEMEFLINLETFTSFQNRSEIIAEITKPQGLNGVVFGRVDYVGSKKLERSEVDSQDVLKDIIQVAEEIKNAGKKLVVGGGVSSNSITFLREVQQIHLSRFETRKVVFNGSAIKDGQIESGLLKAVHFELLWLLNKREYYGKIQAEDDARIEMLEKRWKILESQSRL